MDTTGSMGGELASLRSQLTSTIIPALGAMIPSLGVGIAAHDDFPYGTYGVSPTDKPFYLPTGGTITTSPTTTQAAVNALTTGSGNDQPESQAPALQAMLTGAALSWPGGSVGPFSAPTGTFGAMQFRNDALPIVLEITDAPMHNGKRAGDSSYQNAYSFSTFNSDDVVTAFNAAGATFIGVAADNGGRASGGPGGDPYNYQAYIADRTGALVPPSAFGGSCKTGVNGAIVTPDGPGGQCRLVFSINTDGSGLSNTVVTAVKAGLDSRRLDVYAQMYNDTSSSIDVVGSFVNSIVPVPSGGADGATGAMCVTFNASQLADNSTGPTATAGADGIDDTIDQVPTGTTFCFTLTPKANISVMPTPTPQVFTAWVHFVAKGGGRTIALGADRQVSFVVPGTN
jgi:hypothetical protein